MASVHLATCKCGFEKEITVGGLMEGFADNSTFPYYCQLCGLVEANIADLLGQTADNPTTAATCPECGNKHIDQYGKPPASLITRAKRQTLQAWNFQANQDGNLCPSCKQMTLQFMPAHVYFD